MSSNDDKKPRLLVFAGPNGSGKSTVTRGLPIVGLYINADDIKKFSGCTDLEAALEAEALRNRLVDRKMDFTFETVLSTDRNLELLQRAKSVGYEIHAVFVLTKDSAVNVRRVKDRVSKGGHDVPEEKIRSRYDRSLQRIAKLVRIADRTQIVDNTGKEPSLICEVKSNTAQLWPNKYWSQREILRLLTDNKP